MEANLLRRLNWLWKHRHTHDGDGDCCAQIPELRLQIETAADIRQHTTGRPPAIPDWVTYGAETGTTHDWLVPPTAAEGDVGFAVISLFVHPTSGDPATSMGTVPSGWTLEGSASSVGAHHYFYSKTLTAGDLADGQEFTITENADVAAAWGVVKGNGQTVEIVARSSVGGGIDLPAVSVGGGTYWIVTMSSLNKGLPTGNDAAGAVSAGYELAAYKSSDSGTLSANTYNAAVFAQKRLMEVASSETPADLDWDWAAPGRSSAGMVFAVTGTAGTPDVAPGDHTHVEADVTDLDHWTEADHDALDHTGLPGVGGGGGGGGMTLIEEKVLGSPASSVTFSSIPGSFKDLLIVYQARSSRSSTGAGFRIRVGNGSVDTGNNYNYHTVQTGTAGGTGTASAATGILTSYGSMAGDTADANHRGGGLIWFIDYVDSSYHRQVNMTGGRYATSGGDTSITETIGAWENTAAVIDTIELAERDGNNLLTGSRFALYGTPA